LCKNRNQTGVLNEIGKGLNIWISSGPRRDKRKRARFEVLTLLVKIYVFWELVCFMNSVFLIN
jgi:hypothetical protein